MKRRNSRPGRRLNARPMIGGALPLPLAPGGVPVKRTLPSAGLHAPSHRDIGTFEQMLSPDTRTPATQTRYRASRHSLSKGMERVREVAETMRTWENLVMRLQVN